MLHLPAGLQLLPPQVLSDLSLDTSGDLLVKPTQDMVRTIYKGLVEEIGGVGREVRLRSVAAGLASLRGWLDTAAGTGSAALHSHVHLEKPTVARGCHRRNELLARPVRACPALPAAARSCET